MGTAFLTGRIAVGVGVCLGKPPYGKAHAQQQPLKC